jgi:hypothetical protein
MHLESKGSQPGSLFVVLLAARYNRRRSRTFPDRWDDSAFREPFIEMRVGGELRRYRLRDAFQNGVAGFPDCGADRRGP